MTQGLPNSDQLAAMLLEAAETAERLQANYFEAWNASRTARVNRDLRHDETVAAAYAEGVDGKNAEQRAAQLAIVVMNSQSLTRAEADLRAADSDVKRIEGLLEAAKTYRSALHDLVALRCAELGVEAATGRRAIAQGTDWRTLPH